MATGTTSSAPSVLAVGLGSGPVPFKDVVDGDTATAQLQDDDSAAVEEHADGGGGAVDVSALPSNPRMWLRCYQGTWVLEPWVAGIAAIRRGSFTPRRGDVVLASPPKCGTTWLKALAFATMARGTHPPAPALVLPGAAGHPLLRLNPHDCVPFMEMLFAAGAGRAKAAMDALPSPRLMATHMHHSVLPASIAHNPDGKIVYICREPKDMLVSMWHFARGVQPDLAFSELFEAACKGACLSGPIWDHILGYWNASRESPETVLFLRYEELLRDPAAGVRRLARFVGRPFSPAEVVADVVALCSFDHLRNLEVNRTAAASAGGSGGFVNASYFRRGEAGDWANHMTPEMARRLDAVMEERLRGSGLSFS